MKTHDLDKKELINQAASHLSTVGAPHTEAMGYLPFIEANGLLRAEKIVKIKRLIKNGAYQPNGFKTAETIMAQLNNYSLL
jgi:hypothetical protein